ncbi:hypothetical protein N7489_006179 [Penicillium chrysogenum]|uniref:uncharacterized protein n=1 Tax=Penicillium chrysogenum TaxID=5076 RepID=UPI0024DF11DE|nr:uncharacterized protein N7489_006179 [Penicillium chrysogenum]KAJ5236088.1 hypothetical protein N7489_006179 [Penicillium chrysogenum]KAJ5846872.1 hypothetical protein N7534_010541 [Penicillium rubens]
MGKRIVITGGSGKAGQHIIRYLLQQGHDLLNLDLVPLPAELEERVHTLRVDLTNTGQVYSALGSHFHLSEPFREPLGLVPDAVIHMAGYSRNMIVPDEETFRSNTSAISITVYGVSYAEGDVDYPSFPVDETVDANPMDTYAISKVCGESIARGFARRYGRDIYILRIGRIVAPEEYKQSMFRSYVENPEKWAPHGWAYIDARDLGQMCDRAVQKDGLGFQIFNAVNDGITNYENTAEFLARVCPGVPVTRELGAREAPICNRKIKELLGFREEHHWMKYYE